MPCAAVALTRGYTLNEYRLAPTGGAPGAEKIQTEQELYRFLGLDYIEPELRENAGEIEAAEAGDLPRLVAMENLRGTFHNHTNASDGKATLKEMAEAAQELGLQYPGDCRPLEIILPGQWTACRSPPLPGAGDPAPERWVRGVFASLPGARWISLRMVTSISTMRFSSNSITAWPRCTMP